MAKLMWHDARGVAGRMTHLMQVVAKSTNQRLFGEWAGQEVSIGGQRIEGAKEAQA